MKILVSIASGSNNTERDILRSFYDGIEQFFFNLYNITEQKDLKKVHGIDLRLSYNPEIEKCDIAVQFGTVKDRAAEHHVTKQSIQKNARHIVYVETPLLGRVIDKKNKKEEQMPVYDVDFSKYTYYFKNGQCYKRNRRTSPRRQHW
jgi:hypothetical protein